MMIANAFSTTMFERSLAVILLVLTGLWMPVSAITPTGVVSDIEVGGVPADHMDAGDGRAAVRQRSGTVVDVTLARSIKLVELADGFCVGYDAYGKRTVLAANGTTVLGSSAYGNQIGFTGRYHDAETALIYYRTRYYSHTLGRFLNRMPWVYLPVAQHIIFAYAPQLIPSWKEYAESYFLTGIGSYFDKRYSLYDFNKGDPANRLEPFSYTSLNQPGSSGASLTPEQAAAAAREAAKKAIDPNKLKHIFDKARHGLDSIVKQCGCKEEAFLQIEAAAQAKAAEYLAAGFIAEGAVTTVNVIICGQTVTVMGKVINGVIRVGTAYTVP